MSRRMRAPRLPAWFNPRAYDEAERMDAGDWLLNLCLRRWLHDDTNEVIEGYVRERPIWRRGIPDHMPDLRTLLALFAEDAPSDVRAAIETGAVRTGIDPLTVHALYSFEERLSDELREAGRRLQTSRPLQVKDAPSDFWGRLDDAFKPQMVHRFVRIDLSLPDDVLHADLQRYLTAERARLAELGGPQPYREAAALPVKAHSLRTLANLRLLPYLDLDRWQRIEGLGLTFNTLRELAECDKERADELKARAAHTLSQMKLHAWFARLDRSVSLRPRTRVKRG